MRVEKLLASSRFYLADGGLETFMIFEKGFDLPCFSAAALLETEKGRNELAAYFERYIAIAGTTGRGFVLDAPTWRAGAAWAGPLGKSLLETLATNADAVEFVRNIRDRYETPDLPILLNGLVGPSDDAYQPGQELSAHEALLIHAPQVQALGRAGVDMISAMTLNQTGEAAGIALAAKEIDLPCVIAFTVETDGRLPNGQSLSEAIEAVDSETGAAPIYYMVNCAHPEHFSDVLNASEGWTRRIGGIRANASRMSHAELDEAEALDDGDPEELGQLHAELISALPNIRVIGGCCGTDHRHVDCIANIAAARSAA